MSGIAVLAVILGCAATKVRLSPLQGTVQDLEPDASPGEHAILDYNGPTVPVAVVHTLQAGKETLQMQAFGQTYEQERYLRTSNGFAVVEADGDTFEPPLTILSEEPVTPWSGTLTSGGITHNAKATVKVADDNVKTPKATMAATLASVKLEIDGGGKTPAERTLKFWFVKSRGVIRTEFSMGIKRLPAE